MRSFNFSDLSSERGIITLVHLYYSVAALGTFSRQSKAVHLMMFTRRINGSLYNMSIHYSEHIQEVELAEQQLLSFPPGAPRGDLYQASPASSIR